jgi:hypothetical protein
MFTVLVPGRINNAFDNFEGVSDTLQRQAAALQFYPQLPLTGDFANGVVTAELQFFQKPAASVSSGPIMLKVEGHFEYSLQW